MIELLISVNWWAVLVAAIVYFVLGGFWYSVLFSKKWVELRGIKMEDIEPATPVTFLWTFLLEFIAVATLAVFFAATPLDGALQGTLAGFGAGAGLVFSLTATTGLFSDTKLGLHLIDNGYHVVGLTLSGLILGWW